MFPTYIGIEPNCTEGWGIISLMFPTCIGIEHGFSGKSVVLNDVPYVLGIEQYYRAGSAFQQ